MLQAASLLAPGLLALAAQPASLAACTRLLHSLPALTRPQTRSDTRLHAISHPGSSGAIANAAAAAAAAPLGLLPLVRPRAQQGRLLLPAASAAGCVRGCHTAHAYVGSRTLQVQVSGAQPDADQQDQQLQQAPVPEPQQWQPRRDPRRLLQQQAATPPASALAALAWRQGVADAAAFAAAVSKLRPDRQRHLLLHAAEVSAHLHVSAAERRGWDGREAAI